MTAYLIVDIEVHDPETYDKYKAKAPEFVARHGGEYIVRGGKVDVIEGDWHPNRVIVLRFPDAAAAHAFLEDPGYAPVAELRRRSTSSRVFIVDEGVLPS